MEVGDLECSIVVQRMNSNGVVTKQRSFKTVTVVLGRDEFGDIVLRVVSAQSPLSHRYRLRDISVHKRFAKEGKATIKLLQQNVQIMISNCAPNKLVAFLKCMSLKLAHNKVKGFTSERVRLLGDRPRCFEQISPLTNKDFLAAKEKQEQGVKRPFSSVNSDSITPKRIKRNKFQEAEMKSISSDIPRKKLNGFLSGQSKLTAEQMQVVKAVKARRNVFFTGSAGTGKSFLLKQLIGMLPPENVAVTASTGVAACQIGGTTLHAFAGIGSGAAGLQQCIELASRPRIAQQWRRCRHLIIDEISMIDAEYFDKLEAVARTVRKNDLPFGGIQVILCGDFLQLPPVAKEKEIKKFCFQASSWNDCIHETIELMQVHRQKDPMFISLLQNIRVGSCPEQVTNKLNATRNNNINRNGILATKLCTHKENVNQINDMHLQQLDGESRVFFAADSDQNSTNLLNNHLPVGERIELKLGAQVMLTKNLDVSKGLVNGARGIVVAFQSGNQGYPKVKFMEGQEQVIGNDKWVVKAAAGVLVTRRQLPLKLAWAVSIHKSQGMSLDCVEISLARVFEYGQAYVALSRAKNLQGLRVLDFDKKCVRAHPEVLRFYVRMRREAKLQKQWKSCEDEKENYKPALF